MRESQLCKAIQIACRDAARAELVSGLACGELQYVAAAERDALAGADRSKAAALNRALRRLYPKDVLAPASHLVAVLDDDQARMRSTHLIHACSTHSLVCAHASTAVGERSSMAAATLAHRH